MTRMPSSQEKSMARSMMSRARALTAASALPKGKRRCALRHMDFICMPVFAQAALSSERAAPES